MGASPKVMRVPTRCRHVDEFMATYAAQVDEDSIVVMTERAPAVGKRVRFSIDLTDGTAVMRGEAEVIESVPRGGRCRLQFLALDAAARDVHELMLARGGTPRAWESAGKPIVRVPGTTPRGSDRMRAEPVPARAPIPPVPRRLLPTTRVAASALGAPPRMPEAPEPPPRKQTTRMYGLTPPATPSRGPRSGRPSGRR
jgi:hypothetical protein